MNDLGFWLFIGALMAAGAIFQYQDSEHQHELKLLQCYDQQEKL